jgi:maleylacetoacetate isomerase
MMTLHGYYRSSASFRVRIALNWKGLPYETISHHLRKGEQLKPEYLAVNPQGFVPTLVEGGRTLVQSMAIMEWLEDTHPTPPLLPADADGRARVRALAEVIACDIHPIDNLRVLRYLRHELAQDEESVQRWYNHWIAEGFRAFEELLTRGGTGKFCHGDAPSLADVCLVPQVYNSRNFKLDLSPYPTLSRVYEACMDVPAFADAMPERQPDAE